MTFSFFLIMPVDIQEDGLNIENMPKYFSGKQAKMHSMTIKQERGYLSPFLCTLKPGDT